jgi:N-acetylmuramoyl-L-alanine amidase
MKKYSLLSFVLTSCLTIAGLCLLIAALLYPAGGAASSLDNGNQAQVIPNQDPEFTNGDDGSLQGVATPEWDFQTNRALTETEYTPAVLPAELVPNLQAPLEEAVKSGISSYLEVSLDPERKQFPITLRSFSFDGRKLTIDVGGAGALGEGEWGELLHAIDMKVTDSLYAVTGLQGLSLEYYFMLDGKPYEQVFPAGDSRQETNPSAESPRTTEGIQGQKIALNPGHGYYKKLNNTWHLQRSYYYGIVEDFINLDLVIDLDRFARASGGSTYPVRQLNKNAGSHSTGYPWWQMSASEYAKSLGAPQNVWLPLPYDWSYNHDIMARPEYAKWIGANSMVSIHNNGGGGANCNSHGTEVWYDTANGYQGQSQSLANAIHSKLIQRIRERWDGGWCDRSVKGSNGGYGENRYFNGPAVIVELAFMDVQSDNAALQNAAFRAIAMAAVNEALVQYYGGVTCPAITGWRGEYWNNRDLSGHPVMCRNDGNVNFEWITGGPGGAVLDDHFSARWTRTLNLISGNYRYHVRADDGVRLWVDNVLVIDQWKDQGPTEYTVDRNLLGGDHSIKIEYYEKGGWAVAQFWYERLGAYCPTVTAWKGEYWNNRYLNGPSTLCRNDGSVYFDWGGGSPSGEIPSDNFSARWTRTMYFPSGIFRFHLRGDDGIRLWIDGTLVIDQWIDQSPKEYVVDYALGAGNHAFQIEYYENGGGALVQFWWEWANFALNRPSWASSNENWWDYRASKGNDGNISTRWSSKWSPANADEWWTVDLGVGRTYDRVAIRWETAYAPSHFVGWSDDGYTFYGYWYGISSANYYGYNLGTRNARYVGIYMPNNAPCCGNVSFWEFEVHRIFTTSAAAGETGGEAVAPGASSDITVLEPIGGLATIQAPIMIEQHEIFLPAGFK